ncbi:enoyl-CoA hydratase [Chryseobacterium culicis]|uniref:Enoyl-CoA hydratase n=1 Tax=Chryseobacterium culicis TaxID=680127 RepID=A0A2S9CPK8_CHRCI|nr:enoyl-CoA hydratase [Chryseobacterium culicis]PRB82422.1 enoyl-CoA hydratase [Chryseobacterium culicis]PRB88797.1 enoyl-CoA hydratase [Chryseobacterium culicis]
MLTEEKIFNLIKEKRRFLETFENYKIKISDSNHFERENLIGVYKIRQYTAIRTGNNNLSDEIGTLILNLENYPGNKLRFVTLLGEKYYGIFYLTEDFNKVIGYLDREIDTNEFDLMKQG